MKTIALLLAWMACTAAAVGGSLPIYKMVPFYQASTNSSSGGGGGGGCPADGSPTISQSGATPWLDFNSDDTYGGNIYTNGPTATNLCKVGIALTAQGSAAGSNITVRVYALSGATISTPGSPIAETGAIAWNGGWAGTSVIFNFASDVPLSANTTYAIVATGNGGVGSVQYARITKGTKTTSMTSGMWTSGGSMFDPNDGTAVVMNLYLH